MASNIVKRMASVLASKTSADGQQETIVRFGFEITIYKAIHFSVAVLIGILFGRVTDIIVFHLFYQKLRTYAGGHHAKSNIICFISSFGIAVATLTFCSLCDVFLENYVTLLIVVFLAIAAPFIWFLAPVEDSNKPLDEMELTVYRKKARVYLLIEGVIVIALQVIGLGEMALVGATALFTLRIMQYRLQVKMAAVDRNTGSTLADGIQNLYNTSYVSVPRSVKSGTSVTVYGTHEVWGTSPDYWGEYTTVYD